MEIVSKKHIVHFYLSLIIQTILFLALSFFVIKIGVDENKDLLILVGIGVLIVPFFLVYLYIKNSKKITLSKTGILFGKNQFYWKDIEEINLTGKQKLFMASMESTSLQFKNSDIITIFDNLYSNSSEIKLFINQIVINQEEKFNPNKNEVNNHNLDRELFIPYKGSAIFSFRGIIIWGFILFMLGLVISRRSNYKTLLFVVCISFFWFIMNSFMMYYFEISKNYFVVKNHYFFWVNKIYHVSEIHEIVFETQPKQPNKLRIITKNFKSKVFPAGSLSDKTWLEMKTELESKNIVVRNECI